MNSMGSKDKSFLDDGHSEYSDLEQRYDSEAEELSRGATLVRSAKRRKLSHSSNDGHAGSDVRENLHAEWQDNNSDDEQDLQGHTTAELNVATKKQTSTPEQSTKPPISTTKNRHHEKEKKPGVIYLSSLPPYLRPSALRNLLLQRGFSPISRLFLTPASKASSHHSKKNSRQLYTEGWIEFGSKKVARRCAETLNATPVGGKKGGFYRDDVWNMKYLRGMGWDELMAGVREERREEEGRRDEERRIIVGEAKRFVEGVEKGKQQEGIRKKKKRKDLDVSNVNEAPEDAKRTWRQFEVKGEQSAPSKAKKRKEEGVDDEVRAVLGKIF